ncbi:metalloregulator ArsR/SmtB family transcription factor [Candidatus Albibeggiatoa sp. nov. NOAA]|uniref:ArsR/SmtB family transcription factor n=1 Tax=Candidatus Albibeggiatoa sp. nov. NOAA TaxID=3162724 RepID=UPI0032F78863|nr:metalloregulator ArsR/SmtB family transcription factor [Thiotrichaceae bacterium]
MKDFFQILADETRLRCLALIYVHTELCVCELSYALELSQPKISRHLSSMKLNGLVSQRREGQWMFYSLNPALSDFEKKLIHLIVEELQTRTQFQQDNQRLGTMCNRPECQRIGD